MVEALALSHINYCSIVWGSANRTQIQRLQLLQNFAAKVAHGDARKYDHVTPIIKELNWMKIEKKIFYDLSTLMFKILKGKLPKWVYSFPIVGDFRRQGTRHSGDLIVPRLQTEIGLRAITCRGPKCWNTLPSNVTQASSFPVFKGKLRKFVLDETRESFR